MKDRAREAEKKQIEIFRHIGQENPVRTTVEPSRIIRIPLWRANAYLGIFEGRVLKIILTHTHDDPCGEVTQEARLA